ncbi:MAG: efflux RND transporter periplasmic adaptor subunit [Syntrophothermus sp.]|uniref:efflux RND transporter periplasmic adaptor subunit n=1 Tax=Syntrophothermus sp. TaxID=2736299 RepID=UPI00257BD14F|nr:efflux RND transporter periplasmic adaptor subunit [Syntrophothermus sp.]NSW84456.1 efflux RND transporter periplasmic adaptor subunit [Syntrophothermus sp.]
MRGTKFWIPAAGAVLIVAVIAASAVRGFKGSAVEVKTATAEVRLFEDKVLATGRVEPVSEVDLVSPFAARVLSLKVKEGDRVPPGAVLAELDTKEAEKRVKEAEAALAVAEAELAQAGAPAAPEELAEAGAALEAAEALAEAALKKAERTRYLFDQGAVSQAELEAAETEAARARAEADAAAARLAALKKTDPRKIKVLQARVEQARVAVDNARKTVAEGRLTAPAAGVVMEVAAREGDFLQPGALIMTVGGLDRLQVVADLSEQDIGGIAPGQEAEIQWAGQPGRTWRGKVVRVAPAVAKSREREMENVVRVCLEFNQKPGGLLAGAAVDVFIYRVKPKKVLLVPNEAVIGEGKKKTVFVVEGKTARKRPVAVGHSNELYTEIRTGLKPGERVVLDPKGLRDGQPVRAARGRQI